ncbi:ester cyclase [Burkholderia sp. PAMC 26561]|uniref:ester cyclase n=1 Tax=Burkholderia sp. PAMC 26561 TaxID=1795043 RepID=UPI00076B6F9D|nr:ester cyclase [Burkholderia sp. PAMC 26561]AME27009.1 ester cyclase [Burkholderia sp. PAMC 26561]AME27845.1 ester cyclase [Burkholderia sp. PAMC 26561]
MEHLHEMPHSPQRRLIVDFYRAIAAHDIELLRTVVSRDWQYIPAISDDQFGPDQLIPAFKRLAFGLRKMKIDLLDVLVSDDRVAVRASVSGTQTGPIIGVAATSKPIKFAVHAFHEVKNGKIMRTWHLEDWLSVFQQIGRTP